MTGEKRRLFPRISGKSGKPDSPKIRKTSPDLPFSSNNAASSSGLHTSSRAEDEVSEIGSPPIPQKLRDHAERIREAAEGLNEESADANLDELIQHISRLSAFTKEKEKEKKFKPKKEMPKLATDNLLDAKNLMKLKDVLSEAINATKEFTSDAKTIARGFLKYIMGTLHVVNIAFIVTANAWERYEQMSKNQKACLSLLEAMNKLAQFVRELQKEHKEGMEASISDATALIVEASIVCCTQIEASKPRRYLSATGSEQKLTELEKQLPQMHTQLQNRMQLLIMSNVKRTGRNLEHLKDAVGTKTPVQLPVYPQHAVGIEDPLNEVIEQLEMGSDKKAVAVILHGFGGMGKTTLANAVFARLFKEKTEACKFSFVRLFRNIKEIPNVPVLQKSILFDLKGEEPEEPQSYEEGQDQIKSILEKEEAFIYIDNVLLPEDNREGGPDALTQLLPDNMGNSKKLRLLITSRDKEAAMMTTCIGIKRTFYPIESLPEAKAVALFIERLDYKDSENQLNDGQIKRIVKVCGGVPALLKVLAGFINAGEGKVLQNYSTLMKEAKEKNWNGEIGDRIDQYVFAYDKLEDKLKDPFLDICSFFRGWDWKELSDIVGESQLEKLEKRALVTRDVKSMTASVHDVILSIGLQKTVGERFILTSGTDIKEFLDLEDKDLQKIKGIRASYNRVPLRIPASKLDLISGSLRVLKLGPLSTVVEGKCEKKFEEMVFFSAVISRLPFDMSKLRGFKKLAHLCYRPEDLKNLSQMPSSLRHIEFQLNSPDFEISSICIQQLSNLRVLRLTNAQFKSLPEDLGDLENGLEELSLSSCQYLEDLPHQFQGLDL